MEASVLTPCGQRAEANHAGPKMKRPRQIARWLLFTCAWLAIAACVPKPPLSTDPHVANRQISALLPKGTSESRAKKALVERGFTLSRMHPKEEKSYLMIGTYTAGDRIWQVGVIIVDAKVAATSVTLLEDNVISK